MIKYLTSTLYQLTIPEDIPEHLPAVFDDHSLAFALGIRCKTLWWLLHGINSSRGDTNFYAVFSIAKKSGGRRVIHAPCPALRNVQRAILMSFFDKLETPAHIGAYVPGRGLLHTATQHAGKAVKISLDLKDFFNSTRRAWVRQWLRSLGYDAWVAQALSNLMCVRVVRRDSTYNVLPQGAPTSGLVANWVGHQRIDTPILAYLAEKAPENTVYTRYSDNIEISFQDDICHEDANKYLRDIAEIIRTGGYRLNRKKTHVQRQTSPNRAMRVLGMTVNKTPNIPQAEYRQLRAMVHNCATHGFKSQTERAGADSAEALLATLRGKLVYWSSVNSCKIQPLLVALHNAAMAQGLA